MATKAQPKTKIPRSDKDGSLIQPPRKKTDVRMGDAAMAVVDEMSVKLGIPKNAIFVAGTLHLYAQMQPVLKDGAAKREDLLNVLMKEVKHALASSA